LRTKIKNAVTAPLTTLGLPMLALAWVSIAWGTTWLASKEGVKHMPALQLAASRQFLGGALYVGFFLVKKNPKNQYWNLGFCVFKIEWTTTQMLF